ncbi:MAG TPA: histidinol dehydrogenase [Lachnospiraceae bacterium]|nr:histidinol dehydrogenase [Lachnospiraceae bacterium]
MKIIELNKNNANELLDLLKSRSTNNFDTQEKIVKDVVENIKTNGDKALFDYTKQFDGFELTKDNIRVTDKEIDDAINSLPKEFIRILEEAAENIRDFHEKQKRISWIDTKPDGSILGQKFTPIERVGVYVPGGKAAYPSSVLMNIIPAKVAGVNRIVMVTPPGKTGVINAGTLAAAKIAGADEIYKVGGAQAIAALAYGTESIPRCYKICGPGNIFVALAKKAVYGQVSIDSIAGPSEVLVIADETTNPRYAAADLLSQAEHDELASVTLISTSKEVADKTLEEINKFTEVLERKDIIKKSLDNFGTIFITDNIDMAIDTVNEIAPEHLEILTKNPFEIMPKINNAGAIFLGEYTSEPLGDYLAGPNHVLPTNGTAKFFSPLNVDDFCKKSSIISYSKEALTKVHADVEYFAKQEGLTAHANSVAVRFE